MGEKTQEGTGIGRVEFGAQKGGREAHEWGYPGVKMQGGHEMVAVEEAGNKVRHECENEHAGKCVVC